jgi:hypothetical protein
MVGQPTALGLADDLIGCLGPALRNPDLPRRGQLLQEGDDFSDLGRRNGVEHRLLWGLG